MTRHSLGPWKAEQIGTSGPGSEVFDVRDVTGRIVCEFIGRDNAQLIATAPEAIDALAAAVLMLADAYSHSDEGRMIERREEFPGIWRDIDGMRALIARAKGAQ